MSDTPRIVLAVSQPISAGYVDGVPKTDYLRLAELTGAQLVGNDVGRRSALDRRIESFTALDMRQASHILKHYPDADAYLSFSERVGIPLGMLLGRRRSRPAHIVIAHGLNSHPKRLLNAFVGWGRGVDRMIVLAASQLPFAEGFTPGRAMFLKGGVTDHEFYRPTGAADEGYVLSIGSESRDYETLLAAAEGLDVPIRILSASPWARRSKSTTRPAPANVEYLPRAGATELRDLYARARAVVVPLMDVDYAAGHNAVLEAMCMGKPLVVSGSRGIVDYVEHGVNALVVPVGDAGAMAQALNDVCRDDSLRESLGAAGRRMVDESLNPAVYVRDLMSCVSEVLRARQEVAEQ